MDAAFDRSDNLESTAAGARVGPAEAAHMIATAQHLAGWSASAPTSG